MARFPQGIIGGYSCYAQLRHNSELLRDGAEHGPRRRADIQCGHAHYIVQRIYHDRMAVHPAQYGIGVKCMEYY